MYKRFVSPKAKYNNSIVIVLRDGRVWSRVKVAQDGKEFHCSTKNLQNLTNSELLSMPKYHRG